MNSKAKALQTVKSGLKTGIKKVGKFLDKNLVEPSRNYNKIQKKIDMENRMKGEAGEFN